MRRGFTLIELVVVIALIAILSVTLGPKVLASINQAKVSKVLNNLSNLRIQLSTFQVENGKKVEYGIDFGEDFDNVFQKNGQEEIPTYASNTLEENSKIHTSRNDEGGWVYFEETEELYANLPNSIYTGKENEIWNGEGFIDDGSDNESEEPIPSDEWEDIVSDATESESIYPGGGGSIWKNENGNYVTAIAPGVGWLSNGTLTGNYRIYLDDKLTESGSGNTIQNGKAIAIPNSNLLVEQNSKEVKVAFEYTDEDGNIKYIYKKLELSNS